MKSFIIPATIGTSLFMSLRYSEEAKTITDPTLAKEKKDMANMLGILGIVAAAYGSYDLIKKMG